MTSNEMAISRDDLVAALRNLEAIVVSLDRIGSCASEMGDDEYKNVLVSFLDEWRVFARLSEARRILSEPFGNELGNDGMDELERELEGVRVWQKDSRSDTT